MVKQTMSARVDAPMPHPGTRLRIIQNRVEAVRSFEKATGKKRDFAW